MMYMRGSRRDYDNWAAMGNQGWGYQEVLPYFLKSEDNLQVGSPTLVEGVEIQGNHSKDYHGFFTSYCG